MSDKPLFIPLKKEHFEAFERGEKAEEYRPAGPRWNHRTCRVGRRVTLSNGYGKSRRLSGRVVSYREESNTASLRGWTEIYKDRSPAAVIGIGLDT